MKILLIEKKIKKKLKYLKKFIIILYLRNNTDNFGFN